MGKAQHLFLAIVLAASFGAPAVAETPPPIIAPDGERFTLTPAEGGYVRLNKETGALSYCSVKDGVTACRLGAEERAAFEAEIERLHKENAALKARAEAAPVPPAAKAEHGAERRGIRARALLYRALSAPHNAPLPRRDLAWRRSVRTKATTCPQERPGG